MTDVDDLRDLEIRMHGLERADVVYTLYYDETNNHRKLHFTANGLNVKDPGCFVLAGVAIPGGVAVPDIEELRRVLYLQPTTAEIKLTHVAKGTSFRSCAPNVLVTFSTGLRQRPLHPLPMPRPTLLVDRRYRRQRDFGSGPVRLGSRPPAIEGYVEHRAPPRLQHHAVTVSSLQLPGHRSEGRTAILRSPENNPSATGSPSPSCLWSDAGWSF